MLALSLNILIISLFSVNAYSAVPPAKRELVTFAVGQIKGRVVTSRQVNMSFFVESALYGRKSKKIPKQFYNIKSKEFRRETSAVLLEKVVFEDSKDFKAMKVSGKEVSSAKAKFLKLASSSSSWRKLKVGEPELLELLRQKMQAKKYIRFKVDSSIVPITDDEALEYFNKNRVNFGNLPFQNFKQNIRAFLGRKQIDRRLKDWFEVLQNKYRVRNLLTEAE